MVGTGAYPTFSSSDKQRRKERGIASHSSWEGYQGWGDSLGVIWGPLSSHTELPVTLHLLRLSPSPLFEVTTLAEHL